MKFRKKKKSFQYLIIILIVIILNFIRANFYDFESYPNISINENIVFHNENSSKVDINDASYSKLEGILTKLKAKK